MRLLPRRILSALMLVTGVDRRSRRWFTALLALVVIGFSSRIVGTGYARLTRAGASTIAVPPPATPASALFTSSSPMIRTAVTCFMPVAVPFCRVMQSLDTNKNGKYEPEIGERPIAALDFITSNNNEDSAGWANLSPDGDASASFFTNQFLGNCVGASVSANPEVNTNNGAIQSVVQTIDDLLTDGCSKDANGVCVTSPLLYKWTDNAPNGTNYWVGQLPLPAWSSGRLQPRDCDGDGQTAEKKRVTDSLDCDNDGNTSEQILEASQVTDFESDDGFDPEATDAVTPHSRWGYTLQGPVMLITSDEDGNLIDDFCEPGSPNFGSNFTLAFFAWGAIYDSDSKGSDASVRLRINVDFDLDDFLSNSGESVDYELVSSGPLRHRRVAATRPTDARTKPRRDDELKRLTAR